MESSATVPLLLQPLLGPGEKLLWSGRPRQGVMLRPSDVLLVPFSLLWGGFALFWEYNVLSMQTQVPAADGVGGPFRLFPLFGLPFVLMGLYMMFGRFFVDSLARSRTAYGVTNERVIIVSGLTTPNVKSLNLRTLADLSFTTRSDGSGTIVFGPAPAMARMFVGTGWPMRPGIEPACFDSIPNVRVVHDLIRAGGGYLSDRV